METKNEGNRAGNPLEESLTAIIATTAPKADLAKRAIAIIIDGVIASVLSQIPFVGWIAGVGYILVRDGLDFELMNKQSIGKKFMSLKAVRLDGGEVDIPTSIRRNWMFALSALAGLIVWIPILGVLAVVAAALVSLLIGAYEIYLVYTDPEGRRWGDRFAGTKVIEIDE